MDHQVVSSVWEYGPEYDSYIAKFLELLLKYEYVWSEQDERYLRISLPVHERKLFANDFKEFQKGLTSFDVAFQMKIIRKVYEQELMELEKAEKSASDSKLPWFSKAHRLFSDKTDKEQEILRHENSSISSNFLVTTSGNALTSFQEKSRKSPSLPPTEVPSSEKTTMPMTSVSTTTTFSLLHGVNPVMMEDPKPYTVRPSLTTMADFSSVNPVVTTTNCLATKSYLRTISKISTVGSPYKMITNSSQIRHPFRPPTSISPVSRIPLRLPTRSSTNGAPLQPVISAVGNPLPPVTKPATNGTTLPSCTVSSRSQISLSRTTSSMAEVLISPIATPRKTRVPLPETSIIYRSKSPICTNIQSSSVELLLNPPTSYSKRVPVLPAASSSKTRVPQLSIAPSSSLCVSTSTAPSSKTVVFTSAAPTSSGSVLMTSIPSSRNDIFLPNVLTSKEGLFRSYRSPSYRPGVPPSTVAPYPMIRVPASQVAVSSSPRIFTQADLSPSLGVCMSAAPSSRAIVYTTASDSGLPKSNPSSKDDPSSNVDSKDAVLTLGESSSKNGLLPIPNRSPPPCRSGVSICTVASSSRPKIFLPSIGALESVASFSSTGLPLSPTSPYSSTGVLSPSALSSRTILPFSSTASGSSTGAPLSPVLENSPTKSSECVPEISPFKYPLSPTKIAYL